MTDKEIFIRYNRDGFELVTENLTESEESDVFDAFTNGERDVGKLRELISEAQ